MKRVSPAVVAIVGMVCCGSCGGDGVTSTSAAAATTQDPTAGVTMTSTGAATTTDQTTGNDESTTSGSTTGAAPTTVAPQASGALMIERVGSIGFDGQIQSAGSAPDGSILALAMTPTGDSVFVSIKGSNGEAVVGQPTAITGSEPILAGLIGTPAGVFALMTNPCGYAPVVADPPALGVVVSLDLPGGGCISPFISLVIGTKLYGVTDDGVFVEIDTASGAMRVADGRDQIPAGFQGGEPLLSYGGFILTTFTPPRSAPGPSKAIQVDPNTMQVTLAHDVRFALSRGPGYPIIVPDLNSGEPFLAVDPQTLKTSETDSFALSYDISATGAVTKPDGTLWVTDPYQTSFEAGAGPHLRVRVFDADINTVAENDGPELEATTGSRNLVAVPSDDGLLIVDSSTTPTATSPYNSTNELYRVALSP